MVQLLNNKSEQSISVCSWQKTTVSGLENTWVAGWRKFKGMIIVFFGIKGVIMEHCVSRRLTVNQRQLQKHFFQNLARKGKKKKEVQVGEDGFILYQDDTPAQTALSLKVFGPENLDHPYYLPDLPAWG